MTLQRRVTLTFDNGPTRGITDRVLEILDRNNIPSTFFVIGRNLIDPTVASLARVAHSAGHWIGNHTLTHSVALGDRPEADYAAREIGEAQSYIAEMSDPDKLFRPYGNDGLIGSHLLSRAAITYLLEHRFRTVLWNSVPGDWKDSAGWVETCMAQVADHDWSVVVLHDIENGCLPRLPELLRRLTDFGAIYEQDFPENVILTRSGETVCMSPSYISD
jgi:peptidoglycan/xylan/chitin deacetylase (PgdA/CDA1 family)